MENLLSISLGLGLAAACGFRVFVPLLVTSAAAHTGHLDLASGMEWVGTTPALIVFGTATALEVAAYLIPWVDHLLDGVSAPAAVVAGAVVAASALTEMDPLLKWTLAIIGGGGLAGVVKGTTSIARGASTLTTGGVANPVFATVESGVSFFLSLLALVLPIVALAVVVIALVLVGRKIAAWSGRRAETAPPSE